MVPTIVQLGQPSAKLAKAKAAPAKNAESASSPALEGNHCFKGTSFVERTYLVPEGPLDYEPAFCFNFGNWRQIKVKTAKTGKVAALADDKPGSTVVWKCQDCSWRLQRTVCTRQSEGKTQTCHRVTFLIRKDDENAHGWGNKAHVLPKKKRKRDDTPLHPSVAAILSFIRAHGMAPRAD